MCAVPLPDTIPCMKAALKVDVVIFGGGIAGLWTLNRLRQAGYQAILLETQALGAGQTLKSQGIIHGGLKYALGGFLNAAAHAVAAMPQRWKDCLAGHGEIDLRAVQVLSQEQLLWSTGRLGSEMAGFLASKSLSSRVKKIDKQLYPPVLHDPSFKGQVYRLEELVLDTVSLIETLAEPHRDFIFKINAEDGYVFETDPAQPNRVVALEIRSGTECLRVEAQRYFFSAGAGNEALSRFLPQPPPMQRRPLHMLIARWERGTQHPLFAHCIDRGMNPRITISTHCSQAGDSIWYLGGQLAEEGVHRSAEQQIAAAKTELQCLFPSLDMSAVAWRSFFIDRAEPAQAGGTRPDSAFLRSIQNVCIAWPTKLALVPLLADQWMAQLKQQGVEASVQSVEKGAEIWASLSVLEKPKRALAPWDELF